MQSDSSYKRLTDLADKGELQGKRVFIRSDLNVPRDASGNITEDTRIRASIPAISDAVKGGAAVMVTSHLGRPKEGVFVHKNPLRQLQSVWLSYWGACRTQTGLDRWCRCETRSGRFAGECPLQCGGKEKQR